jgi:hypothetical protein
LNPDFFYQDNIVELLELYRSLTVGASYHRQLANIRDYYRLEMTKKRGYTDVGFRIVKVIIPESEEEQTGIDKYFLELWQLR